MTQYQSPNYGQQGGSVWTIGSGGTLQVLAGGSIQNAGGQSLANTSITNLTATNGTFGSVRATDGTFPGTVSIGGTVGRWAFGTSALTSGVGTVATGLTTVVGFSALAIGATIGAGTFTGCQYDPSLATSGSAILRALSGTLAFTANATVSWTAFGY